MRSNELSVLGPDAEEPVVEAGLAGEMGIFSPDAAVGESAPRRGEPRMRERAEETLDLAAASAEVAGAHRSRRQRQRAYPAASANARHGVYFFRFQSLNLW